jgi:hypothetical protein
VDSREAEVPIRRRAAVAGQGLRLPVLELLPDGSCLSFVAMRALHGKARAKLIAAVRAGEHLGPAQAMRVRVVEYEVPDRDGGTGIRCHGPPAIRLVNLPCMTDFAKWA